MIEAGRTAKRSRRSTYPERAQPRHLRCLGLEPERVVLVGDSVDDARTAQECGVRCVIYHAGVDVLHAREHVAQLGVPVVSSLQAAVDAATESLR